MQQKEYRSRYWAVIEPGQIVAGVRSVPSLRKGWSLVKVERLGICGTDYHAFSGKQPFITYPRILGHEFAGAVVESTDKTGILQTGDRVVAIPYMNCHKCIACRSGKTNCCASLEVIGVHCDGAMQQYLEVPNENLIVANDLSINDLTIVEPLSIGAHAISRANIRRDETVVVNGAGPIGLGIMLMARQRGAQVIGVDIDEHRLQFAKEMDLVDQTVNALYNPVEEILTQTRGDFAAAVFDATGNRAAMEKGIQYIANGGRYILVGLTRETLSFAHPFLHARELSIICSRNATKTDFLEVIKTLRTSDFPVGKYISRHIPFDRVAEDLPNLTQDRGNIIKALIDYVE